MTKTIRLSLSALFAASTLAACSGGDDAAIPGDQSLLSDLTPAAGKDTSAEFIDPDGNMIGNATLTDSTNGVLIRMDLKNIPEGWHGMHLHQVGDCSDGAEGFKASGGHINPDGNQHGLLNVAGYERADMPNIYAHGDGRATAEFWNSYVRLRPGEAASAAVGEGGILMDADGFAIIIHAEPDDHQTQPIGGAGARIACAAFPG